MDFLGSMSRCFATYQKIKKMNIPKAGLGFYTQKYETGVSTAFLIAIIEPPKGKSRGKLKEFNRVIEKSKKLNKFIPPKEYQLVDKYLATSMQQIMTPKDKILGELETLIAGFRLQLYPFHTLKYTFKDPSNPQIVVYESSNRGHFTFYISIVGLKEDGLILAHERQLDYIRQEIKKGIDPTGLQNLPPLRTGETYLDLKPRKTAVPDSVKNFRKNLKHKSMEESRDREEKYATIIDRFDEAFPAPDPSQEAPSDPDIHKTASPHGLFPKPLPSSMGVFPPLSPTSIEQKISQTSPIHPKPPAPLKNAENEKISIDTETRVIRSDEMGDALKYKESLGIAESQNFQLVSIIDELQERLQYAIDEKKQYKESLELLTDNLTLQLQAKDAEIEDLKQKRLLTNNITEEMRDLEESYDEIKDRYEFSLEKIRELEINLDDQHNTNLEQSKRLDDTIELLVSEKRELEKEVRLLSEQATPEQEDLIREIFEENESLADALKASDQENARFAKENQNLLRELEKMYNEKDRDLSEQQKLEEAIETQVNELHSTISKLREENEKLRSNQDTIPN